MSSELPDFVDGPGELYDFADTAESCLEYQESITNVLSSLYVRHVSGDPIQSELTQFLDNYDMVVELISYATDDAAVGEYIDAVDQQGLLTDREVRQLRNLWTEINWIADGYRAHQLSQAGARYWTDTDVSVGDRDDEGGLIVEQRLHWGVDEVFTTQLPASDLLRQITNRIKQMDEEIQRTSGTTVGPVTDFEDANRIRRELLNLIEACYNMADRLTAEPVDTGETVRYQSEQLDVLEMTQEEVVAQELRSGLATAEDLGLPEDLDDDPTRERVREAIVDGGNPDDS